MQEAKGLIITGIITVAILVGGIFLLSKAGNSQQNTPAANPKLLIREDSYQTSSTSAQVTIVEFGDYECPACAQVNPIIKQVIKDYQDKVNFVFRNYPLPQHKNALIAAFAAHAAGEQGKFWEMHDKLYETQNDWSQSSSPLDIFADCAKSLDLDLDKFKSDVSSKKYQDKINQDVSDGNNLNITATPTFYINGIVLPGVPSESEFKSIIDQILSQK